MSITGNAPLQVTFVNTSTVADTYSWNFGDGQSSTQANPNHVYPTAGTYTVSLTVTNDSGTDVRTDSVIVNSTDGTAPPSDPATTSVLTIQRTPNDGGTVTGAGTYQTSQFGTAIAISANPANGYEFFRWTGDTDAISNTTARNTTIILSPENKTITATFEEIGGVGGSGDDGGS